jgi:hypothetical protein
MNRKQRNWKLWLGFGMAVAALVAYAALTFLFLDVPQAHLPVLLLGIALVACALFFVFSGLRRAFGQRHHASNVNCSHRNPLGSISESRFKQGQFRTPNRTQEFTYVICGEKSIVKEHEV